MKIEKNAVIEALRPSMASLLKELKPDAKESGTGKLLARCLQPNNHNNGDASPSMLIFTDNGSYKCQACGLKGSLFDLYAHVQGVDFKTALYSLAGKAGIDTGNKVRQRVTGRFDYLNAEGELAFYKERLEPARDGKRAKEFIIKKPDGKPGQNCSPLLYRLPDIVSAPEGSPVFFTEGEKHADRLASWGLVATTLPHGSASNWRDTYAVHLVGKNIIVLPDNDEPGQRYAATICNALHSIAGWIKVVELPGLQLKGDILDWCITCGNDRDRLLQIIDVTPEWKPTILEVCSKKPANDIDSTALVLRTGRELRAMNIKIEWLVAGVIPRNSVILLYGRGGIGKTTLAMQLADAIDQGKEIFGMETVKTQVIVVDFENSLAVLSERAKRTAVDGVLFCDSSLSPPSLDKADWEAYRALLGRYPGALFIFDTLRSAHGGDENNSETMSLIMRRMRELRDAGATVILLHHTPKGNDRQFKGSGAIFDLCDQTLALYQTAKPGSEKEASDDDDEPDKVYRFGTGKKTRYKPHRVFLKFDTDRELFVMAKDPDDEALESLHAIIARLSQSTCPKQGDIVGAAEADGGFDFGGQKKIRSLLKKGELQYWTLRKGLHNSTIYDPLPIGSFAAPIGSDKLPNRNEPEDMLGIASVLQAENNTAQSIVNRGFGSFSEAYCQTKKLNYGDLPRFNNVQGGNACVNEAKTQ